MQIQNQGSTYRRPWGPLANGHLHWLLNRVKTNQHTTPKPKQPEKPTKTLRDKHFFLL